MLVWRHLFDHRPLSKLQCLPIQDFWILTMAMVKIDNFVREAFVNFS